MAAELVVFVTTLTMLLLLVVFDIEKLPNSKSKARFVAESALILILRVFINIKSNLELKSQTYKTLVFVLMTFGFILLSNYKAQLNAALNVYIDKIPFKTWYDIANSDYKILVYADGAGEEIFIYSKNDSILHRIYNEKVKSVPLELQLQNIKSIEDQADVIKNGKYMIFTASSDFTDFPDFPCKITQIKSPELL